MSNRPRVRYVCQGSVQIYFCTDLYRQAKKVGKFIDLKICSERVQLAARRAYGANRTISTAGSVALPENDADSRCQPRLRLRVEVS